MARRSSSCIPGSLGRVVAAQDVGIEVEAVRPSDGAGLLVYVYPAEEGRVFQGLDMGPHSRSARSTSRTGPSMGMGVRFSRREVAPWGRRVWTDAEDPRYRLSPVVGLQLVEDVGQVVGDSVGADVEASGDFAVGGTGDEDRQDLPLTCSEPRAAGLSRSPPIRIGASPIHRVLPSHGQSQPGRLRLRCIGAGTYPTACVVHDSADRSGCPSL